MNREPIAKYGARKAGRGGFTLLEVLLAMVILAVILSVVYAGFSTSANNVAQAEAIRDETDVARSLLTRLSADIANAYYKPGIVVPMALCGQKIEVDNPAGGDKLRHDSISLTTLTNFPKPGSGEMELWEVGYFFREKETPEGTTYALYRREKRQLSQDVPAMEGGVEYELTDQVRSLQIRYMAGSVQTGSGQPNITWADTWNVGNAQACTGDMGSAIPPSGTLPPAVQITLIMDNGNVYTTQVDVLNKV